MRTLLEIHEALQTINVQEVARRSGVIPKTLYRMRQRPDYPVNAKSAELINAALDALGVKKVRKAKAEA
jgi:hypothetical protein